MHQQCLEKIPAAMTHAICHQIYNILLQTTTPYLNIRKQELQMLDWQTPVLCRY